MIVVFVTQVGLSSLDRHLAVLQIQVLRIGLIL